MSFHNDHIELDPATCHHHWVRDKAHPVSGKDGDWCSVCGVRWIDWTRGFDTNVRPMKKKPEPLVRPNG